MKRRRISLMEEFDARREREDAEKVAALRNAREKGLAAGIAEADVFARIRETTGLSAQSERKAAS